jgi:hypothetical protein
VPAAVFVRPSNAAHKLTRALRARCALGPVLPTEYEQAYYLQSNSRQQPLRDNYPTLNPGGSES